MVERAEGPQADIEVRVDLKDGHIIHILVLHRRIIIQCMQWSSSSQALPLTNSRGFMKKQRVQHRPATSRDLLLSKLNKNSGQAQSGQMRLGLSGRGGLE